MNTLKLGFNCTRQPLNPFHCWEIWKENDMLQNVTPFRTIKHHKLKCK